MSKSPAIVLLAAVARNGVIGGDNRLLWHLSSDLKRFKAVTMGKPLLMGRKTYEAIGRPLPGRETIVVTRDRSFAPAGVHVAHSLAAGLDRARALAHSLGSGEVVVVGGGEIYAQSMDIANRLDITHVDLAPEGDAHFPEIDPLVWEEVSREPHEAGPKDECGFVFSVYERRRKAPVPVEKHGKGA